MEKYLKYKKKYLALKKGGAAERITNNVILFNKFIASSTLDKDEIDKLPEPIKDFFYEKGNLKTLNEDDIESIKKKMEESKRYLSLSWFGDSLTPKILSYKQAIDLPVADHHNVIEIYNISSIEDLRNLQASFSNLQKITFNGSFNDVISKDDFNNLKGTDAELPNFSLKEIEFGSYFNQPLAVGVLPPGLTQLTFGRLFNNGGQPLAVGVLPPGLTQLTFGSYFNQPLDAGVLPRLTHLTFGYDFNQPLDAGVLPRLTHLTFGRLFNKSLVTGVLLPGLTHLTFGYDFNQPLDVDVLPPGLTHLKFGGQFNNGGQPLAVGVLPPGLTHLTFGFDFNQLLAAGVLPPRLTHLTFGGQFNNGGQPLALGVLPEGLTDLTFGYDFNQPLDAGVLPATLINLTFGNGFNNGGQPLAT